jgi:hypothetical protein
VGGTGASSSGVRKPVKAAACLQVDCSWHSRQHKGPAQEASSSNSSMRSLMCFCNFFLQLSRLQSHLANRGCTHACIVCVHWLLGLQGSCVVTRKSMQTHNHNVSVVVSYRQRKEGLSTPRAVPMPLGLSWKGISHR